MFSPAITKHALELIDDRIYIYIHIVIGSIIFVGLYHGKPCTALRGSQRADAMAKLYKKHAGDLDVAAVYAESLMVLKPWAMWTKDPETGDITPAIEGTLIAKSVLEQVCFVLFCFCRFLKRRTSSHGIFFRRVLR